MAGTELMVAGLKSRLGDYLDRINLQINHPGHDLTDKRPRVVWIHHNTDQQWVQWCNDRELVKAVDCFVFVSYWQREQFIKTFGLSPERCIVRRHAVSEYGRSSRMVNLRCAYTSTPFRGLSVLLDAWERLSPDKAELHVWSSMRLYGVDDSAYQYLYDRARSLPNVTYHGIEPNEKVRNALRTMDFFVYPCTFAETACLSVIEAMSAGCRVITPALGALPETTAGYARIYPYHENPQAHANIFASVLADELANPWEGRPELVPIQRNHCSAVYDWGARIAEWRRLIDLLCAEKFPKKDLASFISGDGRNDVISAANVFASKGVSVEIGTFQGGFAKRLMKEANLEKLYCVDPYQNYRTYTDTANNSDLEAIYQEARANLAEFGDKVEFIRKFSFNAADDFPDNSIDFLYIDGNHSYKNVYGDLFGWYPKVKPGGLICGDDAVDVHGERNEDGDIEYVWERDTQGNVTSGGRYGVLKALEQFCAERSIRPFLTGRQTQFLFQKPAA